MLDVTDLVIEICEQFIPHCMGKKAEDLTEEEIKKFIEEIWQPFINKSLCRVLGWSDEDRKEIERLVGGK